MISKERVLEALKDILDPEIGVSLIELGMIRDIIINDNTIEIKMVLTTPFCPLANYMVEEIRSKASEAAEGREVIVIILDEPWSPPE